MEIEDKVLVWRGILGVIAGIISYFIIHYAILIAILFYVASIFLVMYLYKRRDRSVVYFKGITILFATWFLILLILYNIQ
ncbi:MAG: hypothetical protein JZD40_00400 [Sulfolobus sp.]|nr:hypothetical protein [Sulfolobus sp.]